MKQPIFKVLYLFLVILMATFQIQAAAREPTESKTLQSLIRNSFARDGSGSGLHVKSKDGKNHVEVCGDSCTYFVWIGNINDEKFWRFIALYEIDDGPGTDVKKFANNVRKFDVMELIEKKYCSSNVNITSKIKCDWKAYSDSLKIKVGHSRYDEGLRCYAEGIEREHIAPMTKCTAFNPKESPFR